MTRPSAREPSAPTTNRHEGYPWTDASRTRPQGRDLADALALGVVLTAGIYAISWVEPAWSDLGSAQNKAIAGYASLTEVEALTHPSYVLVVDLAYRMLGLRGVTLVSVLPTVAAALSTFLWARACRYGRIEASLLATSLVTTHSVLMNATAPEVYGLQLGLMSGEFLLLLAYLQTARVRYLLIAATMSGFALGASQLQAFPIIAAIVTLAGSRELNPGWRVAGWLVLAFAAGFSPTLALMLSSIRGIEDVPGAIDAFLRGSWGNHIGAVSLASGFLASRALVFLSFIGLTSAAGFWVLARRRWWADPAAMYLGVLALLATLFVATYDVLDAYTFGAPAIFALTKLAIWARIPWGRAGLAALVLLQPICYGTLLFAASSGIVPRPSRERAIPYRDDLHYALNPVRVHQQRGPTSLFLDLQRALDGPRAVLVVDWVIYEPLRLFQQQGRLPNTDLFMPVKKFVTRDVVLDACRANPDTSRALIMYPDPAFEPELTRVDPLLYTFPCLEEPAAQAL